MNIITNIHGSNDYFIRPGTSLNKGGNDYFCHDEITEVTAVPFIWIKTDRAGKCVSKRFAKNYFTTGGYGVRLIANSLIKDTPASWLLANSLNSTTFLSGEILTKENFTPDFSKITEVIEKVSKYTSFNIGDLIALDLIDIKDAIKPINNKIVYKTFNINIL